MKTITIKHQSDKRISVGLCPPKRGAKPAEKKKTNLLSVNISF